MDGRDVVDGRPASLDRRGYVVAPHGELTIDGYRVSEDAVAAFRFSTVSRSYSARKGDARDVGVVGLAAFAERRYVPPPQAYQSPLHDDAPGARSSAAPEPGAGERKAEAPAAPGRADGAVAAAPRLQAPQRPGLGTEFGEQHESRVERTSFERASSRPEAVLTLRYDDCEGLLALGIDVDGDRGRRDVKYVASSNTSVKVTT